MSEVHARLENASTSFRSSRRFACDRCRAYKARCERNGDLTGPCERCRKSRQACTTNFDNVPSSISFALQQQQQQQNTTWRNGHPENGNGHVNGNSNGNGNGNGSSGSGSSNGNGNGNGNSTSNNVPREAMNAGNQQHTPTIEHTAQTSFNSLQLGSGRASRQLYTGDDAGFSRGLLQGDALISGATATDMYITPESSSRRLSSSHSNSGHALAASDPSQLDNNATSSNSNNHWLDSDHTGDLEEMDYSMDFSMPHLVFDKIDFAGLSDHHSTARGSNAMNAVAPGVRSSGVGDSGSSVRRGTERGNHQNRPGSANRPQNGDFEIAHPSPNISTASNESRRLNKAYKDLLRLGLELTVDEEVLEKQKSSTCRDMQRDPQATMSAEENLISRVLRRTSRFWDIISSITTAPETQSGTATDGSFHGDSSGHSRHNSWQSKGHNSLIIVHLITTYVSLIRICRSVFEHLYHVFQVIPLDQVGTVLNLPSLQLGEFQMENNVTIQVQALIELSCSMLLRIEEALGVSTASGPGLGREGSSVKTLESHHCRNSIMRDPVAVSLREIILSQERLNNSTSDAGTPSLQVVMDNLKRLLQRR